MGLPKLPKSSSHFSKEEVDFSDSEKERPTEYLGEASQCQCKEQAYLPLEWSDPVPAPS
jgi:hypothetical protein